MIRVAAPERAGRKRAGDLRRLGRVGFGLVLLSALAACSTQPTRRQATEHIHHRPGRYYPPPGPASDPWGPYIREASRRFDIPEQWIRAVMRQESGGQEDVISWAGAMGLMQVMPETYDGLRGRYNLGDDPFDPHNNILAGSAYLREMYDRYGSPGFLAAYNAGPNRLDRYLNNGTPLPSETVNYVASIAPRLGDGALMSGPLAVYAGNSGGGVPVRVASRTPSGCDPDAAYNPDAPCTPLVAPAIQPAVLETARTPTPANCDPDAAYDPDQPCRPAPAVAVAVAFAAPPLPPPSLVEVRPLEPPAPVREPERHTWRPAPPPLYVANRPLPHPYHESRPIQESMAQRVAYRPIEPRSYRPIVPPAYTPAPQAHWAIQVGAYANLTAAAAAADNARTLLPEAREAKVELLPTAPLGNHVAFRAQISGFTSSAASQACSRISGRGLPCITVRPEAS